MSTVASRPIVLVGMMGSGKTSVGRALAARLGARFVDLDEEVERRAGRRVADIFSEQGEESFRTLESSVLEDVLNSADANVVLSTGGGVVTKSHNRRLLADPRLDVVLLETSIDELLVRLPADDARPLLGDDRRAALDALWRARELDYRSVAKVTVPTTGSSIDDVVHSVLRELRVSV